jgi:hypothetical protein
LRSFKFLLLKLWNFCILLSNHWPESAQNSMHEYMYIYNCSDYFILCQKCPGTRGLCAQNDRDSNELMFCFRFPLFTAVHRICTGVLEPQKLIECIREHPEHV